MYYTTTCDTMGHGSIGLTLSGARTTPALPLPLPQPLSLPVPYPYPYPLGFASAEECSSWNYRQNTIAERPSWHQSEEAPTPTHPLTHAPPPTTYPRPRTPTHTL